MGHPPSEVLRFFQHTEEQQTEETQYRRNADVRMALSMIRQTRNCVSEMEERMKLLKSSLEIWEHSLLCYTTAEENELALRHAERVTDQEDIDHV